VKYGGFIGRVLGSFAGAPIHLQGLFLTILRRIWRGVRPLRRLAGEVGFAQHPPTVFGKSQILRALLY